MNYITINPIEGMEHVEIHSSDEWTDPVTYEHIKKICQGLGFDLFEILPFSIGNQHYLVYLDEEGKLKEGTINSIATFLLDTLPFDVIVGPIIILKDKGTEETYYLSDEDVDVLRLAILDVIADKKVAQS